MYLDAGRTYMPQWLIRRAEITPCKAALRDGRRSWSYAELSAAVGAAAARLRRLGLYPGARVALLAANSAAYAVAVHSLWRLGATAVPLNLRLTLPEVREQLAGAQAGWLLADGERWELAGAAARASAGVRLLSLGECMPAAGAPAGAPEDGRSGASRRTGGTPGETSPPGEPRGAHRLDDTQLIMFTSGTTGRPKGARLTYGNTWWSAVSSALNLGLHADDAWLACLPLYHIGGLSILIRSVIYGITAVVHERFDPERVNAEIDGGRVTIVSVVATMLQRLLDARDDRPFPPTLRCVLIGGGPVPEALLQRALAAGVPVVQTYGMTETSSQVATLPPADARRKAGSAGKALMGVELQVAAPRGEVGEILVRGPVVTPGYWGEPEGAHLDREGWFHTGDLGYLDGEGYLYVVGRRTDLIISGGENIYPAEVERALGAHPQVREVAVVARPDPVWGERPVAFFVPASDPPPGAAELEAHCRERLAAFKVPAAFFPLVELPRNAAGKVLRTELRRLAEGGVTTP